MSITNVPHQPGKGWGVVALAFAIIPLPVLVILNVLSLVLRGAPADDPAFVPAFWIYGLLAVLGVLFFTVFFLLAIGFGIAAVLRPRRAGKVLGWSAIGIVIVSIPFLWFAYLVWTVRG